MNHNCPSVIPIGTIASYGSAHAKYYKVIAPLIKGRGYEGGGKLVNVKANGSPKGDEEPFDFSWDGFNTQGWKDIKYPSTTKLKLNKLLKEGK